MLKVLKESKNIYINQDIKDKLSSLNPNFTNLRDTTIGNLISIYYKDTQEGKFYTYKLDKIDWEDFNNWFTETDLGTFVRDYFDDLDLYTVYDLLSIDSKLRDAIIKYGIKVGLIDAEMNDAVLARIAINQLNIKQKQYEDKIKELNSKVDEIKSKIELLDNEDLDKTEKESQLKELNDLLKEYELQIKLYERNKAKNAQSENKGIKHKVNDWDLLRYIFIQQAEWHDAETGEDVIDKDLVKGAVNAIYDIYKGLSESINEDVVEDEVPVTETPESEVTNTETEPTENTENVVGINLVNELQNRSSELWNLISSVKGTALTISEMSTAENKEDVTNILESIIDDLTIDTGMLYKAISLLGENDKISELIDQGTEKAENTTKE